MLAPLISALLLSIISSLATAHTLPVFAVKNSFKGESRAHELIKYLYNSAGNPAFVDTRFIVQASDNSSTVEVDTLSGGLWTADNTRLWNTSLAQSPERFHKLGEASKHSADRLIKRFNLLPIPDEKSPITFEFTGNSGTRLAREDGLANNTNLKREELQLDISANYQAKLRLPNIGSIAIVGGGGKFQFTFDHSSRLIGHHGTWREIQSEGIEYTIIAQKTQDAQFAAAAKNLQILNFNSTLAYYSAPFGQMQNHFYPVYVYHVTAKVGKEIVELRETMLPATTFGTEIPGLNLDPTCGPQKEPKTKPDPTTKKRSQSLPHGHRRTERRGLDDRIWEFGTEWLGKPWGLSLTEDNANGISNLLFDFSFGFFGVPRWTSRFDWGNNLVWESDWNRNDDRWVDTVDLMFYTGHANGNGWVTASRGSDPTFVDHSIVGRFPENPGDLWGQLDLEWLVIAACGPHQDDGFVTGGGNAFDRWRGVFDGLHVFLGYGSISSDTADEGTRLVRYARRGATLVDSWFRTAKEVQPSGVWVTAMWSGDARQDHLPGHGSIASDPRASAQRWLLWSEV
ncbi:MAG: hypothetical protein LQ337_007270 [Flavoplaca oasis]|nr:MAG: hypothetical protein LQ337_007270 [Flavoplaca oasis]